MSKVISLTNKNTVTKSNHLIEASYTLGLDEQRLILSAISKINPLDKIPDEIKVTAKEFGDTWHVSNKTSYRMLKDATLGLYHRDMVLKKGVDHKKHLRWVYSVEYHKGEGYVTLAFSPDIKPHLSELKGRFTSYQIKQISSFTKVNAIRLYELLQQWNTTGERIILLNDLKRALGLENEYPRWADFHRWVLKPGVEEINAKTNTSVKYETIKKGRSIYKIIFRFAESDQLKIEGL